MLLVGSNLGRDDAAGDALALDGLGATAAARCIVVDPRRDRRPPRRAHLHLQAAAGHRPGAGQRPAAHRDPRRAWSTRRTSPRAPPASSDVAPAGRARTGRTGSSGSPACRWPTCGALCTRLAGARPAWSSPRAGPSSTPRAPTPCTPGSTWRWRSACPGAAGSGYGDLTGPGQRAGRPRARAEGRPAARLPQARRPGRARARRRRVGRRPRRACPGRAVSAYELLDALGTGRRPAVLLLVWRPTRRVGAERRHGSAERLAALDLLVVADFFLSETGAHGRRRAAGHPVGRGGGHDDQPRGPGAAPRAARSSRRPRGAQRARGSGRPGRAARPRRARSRRRRSEVFAELRRASAGGTADYAGITYERLDAASRLFWPCPDRGPPGHAAAVPRPLRHPRRAGPVRRRSSHRGPAERPTRDYPLVPDHRPLLDHYQSGTQTRRGRRASPAPSRSPTSSCTPTLARRHRHRRRRRGAGSPPGAATRRRGARLSRRHPARHRVRALPLGRGARQPADQPARWTPPPGCPSSRPARSRGPR